MTAYSIHNPTKARRVIHTLLPNPPMKTENGKEVPDPMRSHKEIVVEAGATLDNVELDTGLVERLKAQALKVGEKNELQLATFSAPKDQPKTKAA